MDTGRMCFRKRTLSLLACMSPMKGVCHSCSMYFPRSGVTSGLCALGTCVHQVPTSLRDYELYCRMHSSACAFLAWMPKGSKVALLLKTQALVRPLPACSPTKCRSEFHKLKRQHGMLTGLCHTWLSACGMFHASEDSAAMQYL